jgi:hypothetical protein
MAAVYYVLVLVKIIWHKNMMDCVRQLDICQVQFMIQRILILMVTIQCLVEEARVFC